MKCISRSRALLCLLLCCAVFSLSGCGKSELLYRYPSMEMDNNTFSTSDDGNVAGFADNLCVATGNIIPEGMEELQTSAALFSLDDRNVVYANNIYERLYPASITKILTALVFFQNYSGDYSETITASSSVKMDEPGAQVCGFEEGDQIPLDVVLNGLLVYSGNDAANLIAEFIGGNIENFVVMMNDAARKLGATGTNFVNTHGLSNENHYTTAYDLYLIFNEVMKYDKFVELISKKDYTGEYIKSSGAAKTVKWDSTNLYFTGDKTAPENITIIGGKTGTTKAAGACLLLLSQNQQGKKFISVIMKAENKNALYNEMTTLLNKAAES